MKIVEGARLGGYRVLRKIGDGGMGAVYEAEHERLQKRVALKTLHAAFASDVSAVERFTREGRAASRIRHPHVVDVSDVGMADGTPYLVMELLEGESLGALLAREGTLPVSAAVDLLLPVVDALSAAHAAGIIHRDLKPENLFLSRTRGSDVHPVVLDFGISCIEDEVRLTKTAHFMGTPFYMSPEQAQSARSVDARSDQFSLGLVLFELITGRRALAGDSVLEVVHRVSTEGAIRLSLVRPDLPLAFSALVDRMTERSPDARYPSMREVGAALLPFASPRAVALWGGAFRADGVPTLSASRSDSAIATPPMTPLAPGYATPSQTPSVRPSFATPGQTPSVRPPAPLASFTPSRPPPALATDPTVNAPSSVRPEPSRASSVAPPRSRTPLLAILAVAAVLAAVGVAFVVGTTLARPRGDAPVSSVPERADPVELLPPAVPPPPSPDRATIDVRLRAVPANAEIVLDGSLVANGTYAVSLPRDGIPHLIEIRATGYIPHHIEFLDVAPVAEIVLEAVPSHHHGPIIPRRSAMTARGLVAAPPAAVPLAPVAVDSPVPAPSEVAASSTETPPPSGPPPSGPPPSAAPPSEAPVVPAAPTPPRDTWEAPASSSDLIPFGE